MGARASRVIFKALVSYFSYLLLILYYSNISRWRWRVRARPAPPLPPHTHPPRRRVQSLLWHCAAPRLGPTLHERVQRRECLRHDLLAIPDTEIIDAVRDVIGEAVCLCARQTRRGGFTCAQEQRAVWGHTRQTRARMRTRQRARHRAREQHTATGDGRRQRGRRTHTHTHTHTHMNTQRDRPQKRRTHTHSHIHIHIHSRSRSHSHRQTDRQTQTQTH